jgi:hypothetical protein
MVIEQPEGVFYVPVEGILLISLLGDIRWISSILRYLPFGRASQTRMEGTQVASVEDGCVGNMVSSRVGEANVVHQAIGGFSQSPIESCKFGHRQCIQPSTIDHSSSDYLELRQNSNSGEVRRLARQIPLLSAENESQSS